jgi:glycosyltransferase involved in cell wall biosynthesis
MKPRVLVMTTYYYPILGGAETNARQLAIHLRAQQFPVQVLTKRIRPDDPAQVRLDDVLVRRIPPAGERRASGKWVALPSFFATLVRLKNEWDVVVCIDYRGIGIAAITAGRLLGRPVIVQAETGGVLASAREGDRSGVPRESRPVRMLKAPARAIYRGATHFMCIGRDIEREALAAGIPRTRVHYMPHGVDIDRFRPATDEEKREIRTAEGWPLDRLIVLFVGRLSVEKGVLDLLEAWRLVRDAGALLVLVGPDMPSNPWDAGAKARAFIAAHHLEDRVRLHGPSTDTPRLHRAADLFVQPSHFEAFGISIVEAMASGVPVVGAEVGGMRDFLVDGENALTHEPRSAESLAAALRRALGDPPLRARIAAAGLRTAREQFDERKLFAEYARLIETAAARS